MATSENAISTKQGETHEMLLRNGQEPLNTLPTNSEENSTRAVKRPSFSKVNDRSWEAALLPTPPQAAPVRLS